MKLIPAFFQAIYVSYNSLPVSDQIQLLGFIASLLVSIVAIVISLATLHQNSKMLESASRPIVSMYIDSITVCEQTSYFVLKNFGASPAKITTFKYDSILKETTQKFALLCSQFDFVEGIILAPGQSKLLEYDMTKLPVDNVSFNIKYSFGKLSYSEEITVNVKNYIHIPVTRNSSHTLPETEREVQTLREMLERSM